MKMFFRVISSFIPLHWVKIQVYWLVCLIASLFVIEATAQTFPNIHAVVPAILLVILISVILSGWLLGGMLFCKGPVELYRDIVQEVVDVYQNRKQELLEEEEWKLKNQSESNSENA